MRIKIPTYEEAEDKANPTPLDIFVSNNEPAGIEHEEKFRKELQNLVDWILDLKGYEKSELVTLFTLQYDIESGGHSAVDVIADDRTSAHQLAEAYFKKLYGLKAAKELTYSKCIAINRDVLIGVV